MSDDEIPECPDCGERHHPVVGVFNFFEEACKDVDSIIFEKESIMLNPETTKEVVQRLLPHAIAFMANQMMVEAMQEIVVNRGESLPDTNNED